MKNNQRGEVATLVVVGIAAVALLVGTIMPKLNPFNNLFGGGHLDASKQTATWSRQDEIQTPVLLKSGDAIAVGTKVERHYDTGTEEKPLALTFAQRIGKFFAGLTTWGLIFIIASLAFFGGAPLIWLFRKYSVIKQTLRSTIAAIRETDNETFEKLKPHLAEHHDRRDKKIVDKIKSELH